MKVKPETRQQAIDLIKEATRRNANMQRIADHVGTPADAVELAYSAFQHAAIIGSSKMTHDFTADIRAKALEILTAGWEPTP